MNCKINLPHLDLQNEKRGNLMKYRNIIFEQRNGVVTMILNRPKKLNALDYRMLDEIADAIERVEDDDDIKVLIITGKGRAFCSGADLTAKVSGIDPSAPGISRAVKIEPFGRYGRVFSCLRNMRKPTIAAVNGIASGAGLSLAAFCDIRMAADTAGFSAIFVRRGLVADCGATYILPRLMGTSKALEMMWTGDFINADEAFRLGLVTKVVPLDKLMEEAISLANRLAKGPSVVIEFIKRMVYKGLDLDNFDASIAWEAFSQYVCLKTEDFKEGISSFLERREPVFKGK
jgi:2-(1,2-epoxy-1,2-dihydrophenyl)acetyl-CoA isomerase